MADDPELKDVLKQLAAANQQMTAVMVAGQEREAKLMAELERIRAEVQTHTDSNCFEWHTAQLDYFGKFLSAYNGTPKFVINWSTAPCHDDPNLLYHADEDFYNFLEKHEKRLQNAFIFFMGDHGPRYGVVARAEMGKREINNPLLHISVPHWLRNNTQLTKNMEENSQRMILQYDIYETLKDILRYAPESNFTDFAYVEREKDNDNNGTSLLRPFPEPLRHRNCRNIAVHTAYCMCEFDKELVYNETLINDAKMVVIQEINAIFRQFNVTNLCADHKLDQIISIKGFIPTKRTRMFEVFFRSTLGKGEFTVVLKLDDSGRLEPGDFVCCTVKHCLSGSFKCEKKRNWEEAQEISRAQAGLKEPKDEPFDEANIIMAETTAGGSLEDVKPEPLDLDAVPVPAPENDESVYRLNAMLPLSYEPSPDLPPNDMAFAMTRICRGCDLPLSQKEFSAHFLLISQGVNCPEAKCNDALINCPYPDCIAKGFGSMTNYANHLRLHHGRPTFIREFAYTDIAEYRTHLNEIRAMGDYENDKHTKLSGRTYPCRYTHDPNDNDEFDDCDLSHKQPIACGAFYHGAIESRNLTGSPIIHLRVCNLHIHGKMKIPRALRHRIRQLARFMPIPILMVIIRAESGKYAGEGGLLQQILELDALKIGRIIHKGGMTKNEKRPVEPLYIVESPLPVYANCS
ncbi:unnamed protein product, partial [Mesorhabditis spiculigera]